MDKALPTLAMLVAILALAIGGVAYWRSGGEQDVAAAREQIEQEIQELQSKQKELAESASAATRAAYETLQQRMQRAGQRLAELRNDAAENLQAQLDRAAKQLDNLKTQVAEGVKSVEETTAAVAHKTENALAKRVRRMEARIEILEAKVEINRALAKANDNDFDKAEENLREAVGLLEDARRTLDGDYAYEKELVTVEDSLRQAVAAVKAHAQDAQSKIERIVSTSDTLLSALESDEQTAAEAK